MDQSANMFRPILVAISVRSALGSVGSFVVALDRRCRIVCYMVPITDGVPG